jgi:shikimate dehydrogenase
VSRRGAAVLGRPIAHSLSPVLHRAAYEALELTGWTYRAVDCGVEELGETAHLLADEGLAGLSLTMPLKRAVLPMLGAVDEWAEAVGAANTVLFGPDGEWRGANTDVIGMVAVLQAAGADPADPVGGSPCVLGAGATARSVLAALSAVGYRSVTVAARRPEAVEELRSLADRINVDIVRAEWGAPSSVCSAPLVVSTTPAGATDGLAGAVSAPKGLLVDVVYAPWPTPLAQAWTAAGGGVVGGLELLIEQAAEQVRLMTGETPPTAAMRAAGYAALGAG